MKKIIYLLSFVILILTSCSERPNIKIEGSIHGAEKEFLYLDFLNINEIETIDSVKIKTNGNFKFSFYAIHPGIYMLRNESGQIINLLPLPGESLKVEADYTNFNSAYSVAGSQESEYIRQLVEKIQDTRSKLNSLNASYEALTKITEGQASDFINQYKNITKEQRDFSIQFIIEHLSSIASIYALYQEIADGQFVLGENFDIQYMKIVADSVSKYYPDVPFVKSFIYDARNSEKQFYNLKGFQEKFKEANTNDMYMNLPDQTGKNIKIASLKGKVVLVYFWSSKSKESRNMNLSLMKIYEKNKSKGFEIYAIAIDNIKEEWTKAIKFDELNCINVSELTYPESEAAKKFNVKTVPSSFLYNKEGEIVTRDIFGLNLQKWLDNLLD